MQRSRGRCEDFGNRGSHRVLAVFVFAVHLSCATGLWQPSGAGEPPEGEICDGWSPEGGLHLETFLTLRHSTLGGNNAPASMFLRRLCDAARNKMVG